MSLAESRRDRRKRHNRQALIEAGYRVMSEKGIDAATMSEIAEIAESPVHLFIFVKVRENWSDDPERYREMGLEFPRG